MPEGYFSGDKPNPNLRAFVEEHIREKPYDPETDDYDVPAFNEPITTTKATAIYNMHTYWSKKPHDAIRQYIRHYTEEGDLVLDPFCGSGGTALAALMEGRKAIAIDRSPAATFITKNYCTPVDVDELQSAFEELKVKVKPEIDWLYETRCDRCGGKATTAYTVYSQVFQCPRCMEKVPLFDCVEVEIPAKTQKKGQPLKMKKAMACPHCIKNGHIEEISTRSKRYGAVPVLVNYICENGCYPKRDERRHNDHDPTKRENFEKYDLGKLREIEEREIPYWYPPHKMMNVEDDTKPWGDNWRPGRNFRNISELFTKRNLWALAILKKNISELQYNSKIVDALLFAFNGIILINSRMCRAESTQTQNGTYYLPQIFKELCPINSVQTKIRTISSAQSEYDLKRNEVLISTESSCILSKISTNSIDYIFTDPPYADKVQYGELNFIWEAWLGLDTLWHNEEVIVNEIRGKTENDWANLIIQSMSECYRILKPCRWLSLCYHDTSEGTWELIQDIMTEVGFVPDNPESALFIDTGQKTYNQSKGDKVNKRDLVINFRKPYPGETSGAVTITGDEDTRTFSEKVQAIIREYLSVHPGITKDRIYDELVSRMVRKGQMEAHDFDAALCRIADPAFVQGENGHERWYLKETELEVIDTAESAKEEAASESIAEFMLRWLENHPAKEGVHHSDIWEHYVYRVKDKPRRPLVEWLIDYFYKTDEGTYRLPATQEEAQIKKEGRSKGTNRRIKRYVAFINQGVSIPDHERPSIATLLEWLRHCRRSGMYEMGKILYEQGGITSDRLTDEQLIEAEENYLVCAKMHERSPQTPVKRKSKTTGQQERI